MKSFILIAFLTAFSTPTNADMQSLLDNWKKHDAQVMDLKKKPEKYGLAPKGSYQIKYAALNLQITTKLMDCNASNRKLCSNQIATNEVK